VSSCACCHGSVTITKEGLRVVGRFGPTAPFVGGELASLVFIVRISDVRRGTPASNLDLKLDPITIVCRTATEYL
jgi:hypothetical protein